MLSDEEREHVMAKMMFVLVFIFFRFLHRPRQIVHPYRNVDSQFVHNIINGHPRNCLELLRMDRNSFITLCNILKEKNLVEDVREINIEEQVAIFLLTVGHNERNRACQNVFQHSGQTISKYVNLIIRALCQLGKEYISRPNDDTPSKIHFDPRFYPYFKDCLGAIDDTHIPVWVHTSERSRFRNRNGTLSQNVFAVVGFDMRFHYVLAGWEGSATNSRVLYSALDTEINPFVIPTGKYYLGDGGYPNIRGLLTPYRGHRYNLSEFNASGARRVTSAEELFNHRHSLLRTTVKRAFGRLKGRFPILKAQVSFPYRQQVGIVLATCVLHNFIIDHNPHAEQFDVDEGASDDANESTSFVTEFESTTQSIHRGSNNDLRTSITSQMFMDFQIRSFANSLIHTKENHKFQKNGRKGHREQDPALGLSHIVREIKDKHEVKYVYVWQSITGFWGGVRPGVSEMEHYDSKMAYSVASPGVMSNEPCEALNCISANGLGLINPQKVFCFYNELHSYLASAGIDGVKVDVQNILETVGAGRGGRVKLARQYHQALEASIARNYADNGIIGCMSHNTDGLYSSKRTAVRRVSDDFSPRDPVTHTINIASVSYNTPFLGEFMQPELDMFHSLHPMVGYHGAARAVGRCAIFFSFSVSDKPAHHDFDLLKKLVLPDGSILRAKLPGRPTKDCLFSDPTRDGKSLLKIWNLNEHTGVIGVFNCQGAGWCRVKKRNQFRDKDPGTLTVTICAKDVQYLFAEKDWGGDLVTYSHIAGELAYIPQNASIPITLKSWEYEVFTIVPVKKLHDGARFAPIGLIKMFNFRGAITELLDEPTIRYSGVSIKVQGCGHFAAYSSAIRKSMTVDSHARAYEYDKNTGMINFVLGIPEKELYLWDVVIDFK